MDACAVVLHGAKIDPTIDLIPDNFPVLLWTELFSNLNFRAIAFCSIFLVVQPLSSDIPSLLKTLNQFESGLIVMDLSNETELNGLFSRNLVLIGFGNSATPRYKKCPGSRFVEPIPKDERVPVFQRSLHQIQLYRGLCPSSLKDREIQVSILGLPPYVVPTQNGKTGVDINLLGVLAQKLGFTYYFKEETAWQSVYPNGTVHGTIGSVHYNESQIGIGHLIMDESAKKYVDQPRYLYDLNLLFAVPKPKPLPPVLNTLRPFPALLWGSICITVAISGMVIAMIYCCQERLFKKNVNPDVSVPIFWLFACLTSQSYAIPFAKLGSFKLLLVSWIGFTSFITFSYECNLRANLIHVEYEEPLNTLQDLIDKDRQLYLAGGTSFQKILFESIIPEERHFGEMVAQKGLEFYYERDGLLPRELENQILHNGDAYLTGSRIGVMAFPKIQKVLGFQPYRFGQKRVLAFYSGFCTPFQQPWTEDIRLVSGFMDQAGLVSHQLRKFMPTEYLSMPDDNRSVPIPFALEHLAAAMLILVSGYVLGFGALTMELLIKRKPAKRSMKNVISLMKK